MKEIERKYLASIDHFKLPEPNEVVDVKQGYLVVTDSWEFRIRRITVLVPDTRKDHSDNTMALKVGNGFIRREYEWYIPNWLFGMLAQLVPKNTWIYKVRFQVRDWMLDVFYGRLKGLVLCEIEIPTSDTALPELPAGITLEVDVTGVKTYANKVLSRMNDVSKVCNDIHPIAEF